MELKTYTFNAIGHMSKSQEWESQDHAYVIDHLLLDIQISIGHFYFDIKPPTQKNKRMLMALCVLAYIVTTYNIKKKKIYPTFDSSYIEHIKVQQLDSMLHETLWNVIDTYTKVCILYSPFIFKSLGFPSLTDYCLPTVKNHLWCRQLFYGLFNYTIENYLFLYQ